MQTDPQSPAQAGRPGPRAAGPVCTPWSAPQVCGRVLHTGPKSPRQTHGRCSINTCWEEGARARGGGAGRGACGAGRLLPPQPGLVGAGSRSGAQVAGQLGALRCPEWGGQAPSGVARGAGSGVSRVSSMMGSEVRLGQAGPQCSSRETSTSGQSSSPTWPCPGCCSGPGWPPPLSTGPTSCHI